MTPEDEAALSRLYDNLMFVEEISREGDRYRSAKRAIRREVLDSTDVTEIDVWYGLGDSDPVGPLEATLVNLLPNGQAEFLITDEGWLDHIGEDEPLTYTARRRYSDGFVGNDDYSWTPKEEHSEEVKTNMWWRK
jgi:hypothetical protein